MTTLDITMLGFIVVVVIVSAVGVYRAIKED